jgi:hypothetical protein
MPDFDHDSWKVNQSSNPDLIAIEQLPSMLV